MMADLVTLNVGGSLYTTTVATLTRYPDSMLGCMFSDRIPSHRDRDGNYIIDGDGPIFRHVLNFLRRSSLCLPRDFKEWDLLKAEADFYQIRELIDAVKSLKERSREGSRQEMEFIEITFWENCELTFRGTEATLKAIPTLMWAIANLSIKIEDSFDENGKITVYLHDDLNRMGIYQEITRLGFRLLNTLLWEHRQSETILFGRNR